MIINGKSKRAQGFLQGYYKSDLYYLTDCYNKPSIEKSLAYDVCFKKFCANDSARDFRIISYNTFQFTVGWLYRRDEDDVLMLHVETAYNVYDFEI